jgi:hypothetical protein
LFRGIQISRGASSLVGVELLAIDLQLFVRGQLVVAGGEPLAVDELVGPSRFSRLPRWVKMA